MKGNIDVEEVIFLMMIMYHYILTEVCDDAILIYIKANFGNFSFKAYFTPSTACLNLVIFI